MPQVKIIRSDGAFKTGSGGCFGFCGRSNSFSSELGRPDWYNSNGNHMETFRYIVGERLRGIPSTVDLVPIFEWAATNSPWSKYVKDFNFDSNHKVNDHRDNGSYVDIRTDIPGHAVIGTASLFRFIANYSSNLVPYFNSSIAAGVHPTIAFLLFYSLKQCTTTDFKPHTQFVELTKIKSNHFDTGAASAGMGLGDEEVLQLSDIAPGHLYSLINNSFEMKEGRPYRDSFSYDQAIVSSYRSLSNHGNRVNFANWAITRFKTMLVSPDVLSVTSGMGSQAVATRRVGLRLSSTIGWGVDLTHEYLVYGRFLGWRV